jgi:aldehyde dehydrogenase (NAD+)
MQPKTSFFIDGRWTPATGDGTFPVLEAATGEVIGRIPVAMPDDMDAAVTAARGAGAAGWAAATPGERADALHRFAAALEDVVREVAETVSRENGMPIRLSRFLEGKFPLILMRYYSELIRTRPVEELRESAFNRTLVRRSPVGVVAAIVPWNYPVTLAVAKLAPALAAGCTVVVKPSPGTSLDSYLVAEAAERAGLPAGVVNWVPGDREVGAYLVQHPGVNKVAFTGSTAAGRAIGAVCGRLIRPVTLELGGKSAAIVLPDADLSALSSSFFAATLANNGQTCVSCSRVLAPSSRYDEVVEFVAGLAADAIVGDPLDPATTIGPMASAEHRLRVEGFIAKGIAEGARRVTGGGRPAGLDRGWFVQPTVFADVENNSTLGQEEIFGPVLSVIRYQDEDDAVRIANDSDYGLGGSVWSADANHAAQVARRVDTGTIGVNGYSIDPQAPFGGVKQSGLGREFGPEAVLAYERLQSIYLS